MTFRFVNFNTKTLNFRGDFIFRHYLKVCENADCSTRKIETYFAVLVGLEPGATAYSTIVSTAAPAGSCTTS